MVLPVWIKLTITFILFLIFVSNFSQVSCTRFPCSPQLDYKVDCNRCWCLSSGSFVCTKMICNKIPKRFWSKVRLNTKRRRSFTAVVIALVAAMKIVKLLDTATPLFNRVISGSSNKDVPISSNRKSIFCPKS